MKKLLIICCMLLFLSCVESESNPVETLFSFLMQTAEAVFDMLIGLVGQILKMIFG